MALESVGLGAVLFAPKRRFMLALFKCLPFHVAVVRAVVTVDTFTAPIVLVGVADASGVDARQAFMLV